MIDATISGSNPDMTTNFTNMTDISKCKGDGCPAKELCYRFTAKPNEYRQSYFVEVPYKDDVCDHFWGENQEQIWNSLKDIVNGKDS